jgi:hypothetical protein
MRVKEIEKLFQDIETLDLALEDLIEDMKMVDNWTKISLSEMEDNPEQIKKALNQLSIAYGNFRIVLGVAETEYRNREVRYYNEKKLEAENMGKKFVSGQTEKEASAHVAEYRRIRNIVQAYKESADKRIITLQSILKDIQREYREHPSTEA